MEESVISTSATTGTAKPISQSKSVESFLDLNFSNLTLEKYKLPSIPSSPNNDTNLEDDNRISSTKLTHFNNPIKQTSTQTLLEMLKAYNGITECSTETAQHIDYVSNFFYSSYDSKDNYIRVGTSE